MPTSKNEGTADREYNNETGLPLHFNDEDQQRLPVGAALLIATVAILFLVVLVAQIWKWFG